MAKHPLNMKIIPFLKEQWHFISAFILVFALLFIISFFVIVPFCHANFHNNTSMLDIFHANAETFTKPVYLVGISGENFPPLIIYDGDVPTGFDIDLMTWIANDANLNITFVQMTSIENAFDALRNEDVDMLISGLSITPKRMEEFLFSIPYMSTEQQIAVKSENNLTLYDFYTGSGLIGVISGTNNYHVIYELFLERNNADPSRLLEIDGHAHVIEYLVDEQIDFMVADQQHMRVLAEKYQIEIIGSIFTGEHFGIVFPKNSVLLQKRIDDSLEKLLNSPDWDIFMQKYYHCQQL